jgi:hypothetical protein
MSLESSVWSLESESGNESGVLSEIAERLVRSPDSRRS